VMERISQHATPHAALIIRRPTLRQESVI
jgi:hypothetical protein